HQQLGDRLGAGGRRSGCARRTVAVGDPLDRRIRLGDRQTESVEVDDLPWDDRRSGRDAPLDEPGTARAERAVAVVEEHRATGWGRRGHGASLPAGEPGASPLLLHLVELAGP